MKKVAQVRYFEGSNSFREVGSSFFSCEPYAVFCCPHTERILSRLGIEKKVTDSWKENKTVVTLTVKTDSKGGYKKVECTDFEYRLLNPAAPKGGSLILAQCYSWLPEGRFNMELSWKQMQPVKKTKSLKKN